MYQLYVGNVTSINPTRTNLYTVPAGDRIVVREVDARNLNASAGQTLYLYVNGTVFASLVATSGGSAGGSVQWKGAITLNPGDVLGAAASSSTGFGVVASGYIYTI